MTIELEDVKRLNVRDGDILVVTLPDGIHPEARDVALKVFSQALSGRNVPVVVAPYGTDISIVNCESSQVKAMIEDAVTKLMDKRDTERAYSESDAKETW